MKMKIWCLITFICLVLGNLTGCGEKETGQDEEVFDLAQLQTEEGVYQYKDIPFGSSYEEVSKKIPIDFQEPSADGLSSWEIYYAMDTIDFEGENGKFSLEFMDDQLKIVKVSCELSGGEEQFEKLAGQMVELYGEAEVVKDESTVIYKWVKGGNVLNAILTKENGAVYGMFGVFTTR